MNNNLELARRLELAHAWRKINYTRAQEALRPDAGCAVEPVAGGYAIYAGAGSPLNGATALGMGTPVSAEAFAALVDFYHSRGSAPALGLCPLADSSLWECLNAHPLQVTGFLNVLFCPLQDVALPELLAGVQVRPAAHGEAGLWIRTTAQGFSGLEEPPQADVDILTPNFYAGNAACFMAWVDGQPAGGGGMYLHEGVAEMGGASTVPALRRRGVQTALLYARMAAAQSAGCDLALVLTDPGSDSQRNVERIGFRVAYTQILVSLR